jgi:hypothetical protein
MSLTQIDLDPIFSKSRLNISYNPNDINCLNNSSLDLILRVNTPGIFKGKILNCSRLGILSFHHADNLWNRGGPAGFWEVYYKKDSTGFIIQLLNEELDGGKVLFRGEYMTKIFYSINQQLLLERSYHHMYDLIIRMINNHKINFEVNFPYDNVILKAPSFKKSLYYLFYLTTHVVKSIMNRFLFPIYSLLKIRKYPWSIYFIKSSHNNANLRRAIKIKNPKNRWFADPFVIKHKNRDVIYFENFNMENKTGSISCIEIKNNQYNFLGRVISEKFHLSYPFVYKYDKNLYMIPDSSTSNSIRLYKCIDFPLKWEYQYDLISNIDTSDSIIFKYNDRYWLFTNPDPNCKNMHESQLNCYYSESPISSNWTPHDCNPIAFKNGGRNGGFLYNELIRVGQNYKFNEYGTSLSLYKIIALEKNDYKEELIDKIEPNFSKSIKGIHHISSNQEYTVFDTKNF